ncbi:MAG: SirB2 family protein [Pseudomonadales bacterium]|nr:SirB2 family protein [Pseudomonadales bacterium]
MYTILKNSHIVLMACSFLFFLIRALWAFQGSTILQNKIVRILPHIIDTFLLLTAIGLMATISQYPFMHSWLTAKILALMAYIIFATWVIKHAKNNQQRSLYFVLAISTYLYMFLTARSHNALFFL